MQYGKEPADNHLGLVTTFYLYRVVLAKFLCCWELSLVDVGMKMYIRVIRKKITSFSQVSSLDFTLLLKGDKFLISFSPSHSKGLDLLQIFCILISLIETLFLYNLVSKSQLGMDVLVFYILAEILLLWFQSYLSARK